jgi:radical SAM protein with 4Fe4S-binding SPASM domain
VIFWSLVKHADIDDGLNVRPIFALGAEARTEARRTIDRAVRILGEAGLTYEFTGSFFDVFKERAPGSSEGALATSVAVGAPSTNLEAANRIYARAPEGWTRECFDPWNYVQIKANGDVYPCCTHSAIGRIEGERGLGAVLDGEILARLREGLLSGHLDEECRNCHLRAFIPVVDYQKRYADVFGADPFRDHPIVAPPWTSSTTGATTRRRFTRGLRASMLRWRARLSGRTIIGRLDAPPTGIVSSRTLQVRGWAFSTRRQSLSGVVAVNGAVRSQIATRYPRADVRAALGTSVPLACGFAATLELPESLQPGESCRVEVSFQDEGGARLEFPASFLTVVDSRPFGP